MATTNYLNIKTYQNCIKEIMHTHDGVHKLMLAHHQSLLLCNLGTVTPVGGGTKGPRNSGGA